MAIPEVAVWKFVRLITWMALIIAPWGRVGAFKAAPNYKEGDSVTCQSQNTYSDRGASVRCIRIDE